MPHSLTGCPRHVLMVMTEAHAYFKTLHCIMFTNILLTKANCMTEFRIKGQGGKTLQNYVVKGVPKGGGEERGVELRPSVQLTTVLNQCVSHK